ncbi:CpaD family pilus assembly protein [Novosphingobium sp. JCM 18896]|uniref:CpaD family pilus assembly protein n=1 Tax=Novosphingobium sp. JCM 18896 TaxID=2989731 RepID=UPI002222B3F6|nr:CpaD family pilus assembly protein [Novosphingobium sp. JCM 18896]MCW1427766.1 CpaD family pilus assembly protein [Novosphingobium sp. JCM 18896]
MTSLIRSAPKIAGAALALSLGLTLAGCGGIATNGTLDSVHQPVVEKVNYTLDVNTGPGGLSVPEQRRIDGWFDAMDLRYGDRIAIDDPLGSEATRAAVASIAARRGLILSDTPPPTQGYVTAGNARVIVTRAKASVPECPNWSSRNDFNPRNATSSNFGCAVNSNIAAMVANPEHLLKGEKGESDTVLMGSNKAIGAFRNKELSGAGGGTVKANSSKGD